MNARKARQQRAQGGQKRLRRYRKDVRAAEDTMRAELEEGRVAQEEQTEQLLALLAAEPQYAIISPFTGEIAMLAAESMILPLGTNAHGEPVEPQPVAGGEGEAEAGVASGEAQDASLVAAEPE